MHRRRLIQVIVCVLQTHLLLLDCTYGSGGAHGWGHSCCEYSINPKCKNSCKKAKSRDELGDACSVDQEFYVLACLDKQEAGRKCCPSSVSTGCFSACRTVFMQEHSTLPSKMRRVVEHCSQQVAACVQNYTRSLPVRNMLDSLSCCEKPGISETCQTRCVNALKTLTTEDEVMDEVVLHCGEPDLSAPLWQCFLRSSNNHIRRQYNMESSFDLTNRDSTRLMCCPKASTPQCRNLCIETYSRRHVLVADDFDPKCSYSLLEKELNICLEEVDSHCEPGCSRLSYCSNFNGRPQQSFRSCDPQSDEGAREAVKLWAAGVISMPSIFDFDIPIKDIGQCEPSKWKAIACTMQIKPCHHKTLTSSICRSDCIDVLSKCLDMSRIFRPDVTPETICSKLSPQDDTAPCVSLSLYSAAAGAKRSSEPRSQVSTPCNPNPCNASQVCVVSWRKCSLQMSAGSCQPFICQPGCPLGDSVTQIIPQNTYIRVPDAPNIVCYRACWCSRNGLMRRCNQLKCVGEEQCIMASGMIQGHGSVFNRSCNRCACHSGQVVCTNRFCATTTQSPTNNQKTNNQRVLPCGCLSEYQPVCGSNGRTYPSFCLARCAGLNATVIRSGSCLSPNPCSRHSCSYDERCVTKRRTCLGLHGTDCKQYECVKLKSKCDLSESPVCDASGRDVPGICQLLLWKRTLAYRGRCLFFCQRSGSVCGIDGDDYPSECAAWAAGVIADYTGPCRATGGQYQDGVIAMSSCPNVTCSNQHIRNCQPIVPPGACCPICAGEIRLLISPSSLESASAAVPGGVIAVSDVLEALRLHIKVLQCEVFGYISIEGDMTLLLMPIVDSPTSLQIEACMVETERLAYLLGSSNPTLTTYLSLSFFISADVRTCQVNTVAVHSLRSSSSQTKCLLTPLLLVTGWMMVFWNSFLECR